MRSQNVWLLCKFLWITRCASQGQNATTFSRKHRPLRPPRKGIEQIPCQQQCIGPVERSRKSRRPVSISLQLPHDYRPVVYSTLSKCLKESFFSALSPLLNLGERKEKGCFMSWRAYWQLCPLNWWMLWPWLDLTARLEQILGKRTQSLTSTVSCIQTPLWKGSVLGEGCLGVCELLLALLANLVHSSPPWPLWRRLKQKLDFGTLL